MKTPACRLAVSVALLLILSPFARAGLKWERTDVELKLDPKTEVAHTVIGFKNTGDKALTILEVKPSCGCTTTSLDKKTYQPGETGQLHINMDLANASGTVTKSVEVVSDDAPEKPATLTLHATIPEPLTLSAKVVAWKTGEADVAKEISLTLNPALPNTQIVAVRSNAMHFSATLKRDSADGRQVMVVKPLSTATPAQETIFIDSRSSEAGALRTTVVFAQVR